MAIDNSRSIDLRTDVKTLPTPAMLEAIRAAVLGDSKAGEDPTVSRLEAMAAAQLGTEAALLMISGTMANLCAILALTEPGDGIVLEPESHIYFYEKSHTRMSGTMPVLVPSYKGMIAPDELDQILKEQATARRLRLLCLENTHNRSGGRVVPLALHRRLCDIAHARGLAVHVDGARLFNAAVAAGVPAAAYAASVDTVMFCLSKSLSCPLGSVLCGRRECIDKARGFFRMLGGGMRQAGVIAAPGIVALETMIERLAEDHANARRLAVGLGAVRGIEIDLETVETNMVNAGIAPSGRDLSAWIAACQAVGVLVGAHRPGTLRFVTHRHHTPAIIDEAVRRLGGLGDQ